ncbi:MAG: hypothetical protein ACMVY4_02580 [Minwuia sp.]|uniref:hypothetical protein n=1 Tax=Minwuia sp. TaxID=2493630 RepID=UPI003A874D86
MATTADLQRIKRSIRHTNPESTRCILVFTSILWTETTNSEEHAVKFPYHDLRMAINICRAAPPPDRVGISLEQFAIMSGHRKVDGTLKLKIASAKLFGLVDSDNGIFNRTDLGEAIHEDMDNIELKRKAFFNVELYCKFVQICSKQAYPNTIPEQNELFTRLGLSEKSAHKARIALIRSAQIANIFVPRGGYVHIPKTAAAPLVQNIEVQNIETPPDLSFEKATIEVFQSHGRDAGIAVLISKIPAGDNWELEKRRAWEKALLSYFDLIYET